MRPFISRSILCSCLALAVGCGDSNTDAGLGKAGSDLKDAGAKAADQAKDASAAMSKQLADAGATLDKLAADAKAGMTMKGDELAKMLKAKMPDLQKLHDTVKAQLEAKGGAFKDMIAGLNTKHEALSKSLDTLTTAGANATADVKKAALDAYTAFTTGLSDAVNKLKG